MTIIDLVILGIVIGSNNLAVALALGALGQAARRYRVMLVFGLFEFWIPLIGIWIGSATAKAIALQTNFIGGLLLIGLGLLTVVGGIRNRQNDEKLARYVTRWRGLIFLAAGLSTDNLVVSFSLGLGNAEPLAVASAIAFFSVLFTWVGMRLGRESRRNWERMAKLFSGLLLIGLGMSIMLGWF